MPFGAVFSSLLLGLVGLFLPLSALSASSASTALGRVALGMICLNVSIGLLRRQPWARWGALFVAAVLLVLHDLLAPPGGAVAKLAILFGAVLLDTGLIDHPRHAAMGEATLRRVSEDG